MPGMVRSPIIAASAEPNRTLIIIASPQDGTAITTGDGKAYAPIPNLLTGFNLSTANAQLIGASSSGDVTIMVHNVTQAVDMLSTGITVQANELHSKDGTPGVVNTANDNVFYGDLIRVDFDAAGTGADGVMVILEFAPP